MEASVDKSTHILVSLAVMVVLCGVEMHTQEICEIKKEILEI